MNWPHDSPHLTSVIVDKHSVNSVCLNLPVICHNLFIVLQDYQPDSQKSCWWDPSPSHLEGPMESLEASPLRGSVAFRRGDPGKSCVVYSWDATWEGFELWHSEEGLCACSLVKALTNTQTHTYHFHLFHEKDVIDQKLSATVSFLSFRVPPAKGMAGDLEHASHACV